MLPHIKCISFCKYFANLLLLIDTIFVNITSISSLKGSTSFNITKSVSLKF